MATIPDRIPKVSPEAIASYDWIDIADGTGMRSFYLCATGTSSGEEYILTQNALPTANDYLSENYTTYTFTLNPFTNPKTIGEGTGYICLYGRANNGDTTNWTVKLQKVDVDDNAIDLTTAVTSTSVDDSGEYTNVPLEIPETHFKRGESLRLHVTTEEHLYRFWIDPLLTDSSVIYIPFRIDL